MTGKRIFIRCLISLLTILLIFTGMQSMALSSGDGPFKAQALPLAPMLLPVGQSVTSTNVIPPPPPPVGQALSPQAMLPPTVQAAECAEYIQYGNFEYNAGWNASPPAHAYYNDAQAYRGSWSAYMNTYNLSAGDSPPAWWQAISIPAEATTAFIQFYTLSPLQDEGEQFYFTVWDESFTTSLFSTSLEQTISGWNVFEFNLPVGSMAGQTVNVVFQIDQDGDGNYSELYLDEVSLNSCVSTPQPPPAQAVPVGQAADGSQVQLADNQYLVVSLEANPSAGYVWQMADGGAASEPIVRQAEVMEFESPSGGTEPVVGAPVNQLIRFDPLQAGSTTINLVYQGPDSGSIQGQAADTFSLQVDGVGVFADSEAIASGGEAVPSPVGFPAPETAGQAAQVSALADVGLPAQFNWCDQGHCPAVRNQGRCGSCWAFATAGATEIKLKTKDAVFQDLSEQFLVSCNTNGYGCGGGWWAFDYYWNRQSSTGGGPGTVYEASFPYVGQDVACQTGLAHHEKLDSWAYVDNDKNPSVEAIKQAIHDHGPVAVAVCAGWRFQSYGGGIFRTNDTYSCGGGINHGVVLTGWNDSEQVFYLRNSWGSGWGENGYMRIAYGVSNLGYGATYALYQEGDGGGDDPPNPPSNLSASVSGTTVNLSWADNSNNEDGFYVYKWDGASWSQLGLVGPNVTTYADSSGQCNKTYYYLVAAYNSHGSSNWSNMAKATTGSCGSLAPPSNLQAVASGSLVYLSWDDNNHNENGFLIARWQGNAWQFLPFLGADTTSYIDRNGRANYYYVVTTYNNNGYSNWSNMARATVSMLNSPRQAEAVGLNSRMVKLSWVDSNVNEGGYTIERWNGSEWEQLEAVEANTTTYFDNNLQCDTKYYYMLYATNLNSYSHYSNLAQATTRPCGSDVDVYLPAILK